FCFINLTKPTPCFQPTYHEQCPPPPPPPPSLAAPNPQPAAVLQAPPPTVPAPSRPPAPAAPLPPGNARARRRPSRTLRRRLARRDVPAVGRRFHFFLLPSRTMFPRSAWRR